ncbi:MAG: GerMN domain-containing protein [Treponema sp.]|nr:GerMN domain-containing protein [Treponema sp.]
MSRKEKETDSETKKSKKKKSKNSGIGVALFFLVMIVLFIIFLVELPTIKENISLVMASRSGNQESAPVTEIYNSEDDEVPQQEDKTLTIKVETEKKPETPVKPEKPAEEKKPAEPVTQPKEEKKQPVQETQPASTVTEVTTKVSYTELQLCFVEIDSEGAVSRKMIKRSIPKNDSPLSTAIKLLLEGPDTTKAGEKNCETLIPAGTKLLSAKVQGGIAYLNFNDKFNYNEAGIAGSVKQLEQIVYTATNFSTVNSVQFLIEGEKQRVLEGAQEGLNIDVPLSRASFK